MPMFSPTVTVLRLMTLLMFYGSAIADITSTECYGMTWAFNSLGQSPCEVLAYLLTGCGYVYDSASYQFEPIPLIGSGYTNPDSPCICNTVAYSLLSACEACQGLDWPMWGDFTYDCSETQPPTTFPILVPDGTSVPHWSLIDVTVENDWDLTKSQAMGGFPELTPGTPIRLSTGTRRVNAGAIAGGIVGGVAVISIAAATIFYRRRHHPTAPPADTSQPPMEEAQQPLSQEAAFPSTSGSISPPTSASLPPESPVTSMRLYNPNNPATFPELVSMPDVSPTQPSFLSHTDESANGTSLTTVHTTQPHAHGYHGLPTV